MGRFELTKEAKSDLGDIYRYGFEHWGERQADDYYWQLFSKFDQIAERPQSFATIDEVRSGYRQCVVGAHTIYFRVNKDQIAIIRILGRQDREAQLP
jgi:toxin ParE1/3/4